MEGAPVEHVKRLDRLVLVVSGLWFVALVLCPLLTELAQPFVGCLFVLLIGLSNWICLNLGLYFGRSISREHSEESSPCLPPGVGSCDTSTVSPPHSSS